MADFASMTILVTISSWGTNTGPYYKIIALPGGTVISAIESQWIGPKMFTNVPAGTTSVRIESINYNGTPGLCGSTDIPVTLLDATTTTTTTGGVTPPTTSTTTTSSTSSTTTTTTTSGTVPPTSTSTTTSSTSSTTSSTTTSTSSTTTTSTTIECPSCYYYDLYCDGVEGQSSVFDIVECDGTIIEQSVPYEVSPMTFCLQSDPVIRPLGVSGHFVKGEICGNVCDTTTTTSTSSSTTTTTSTTSEPTTTTTSTTVLLGNCYDIVVPEAYFTQGGYTLWISYYPYGGGDVVYQAYTAYDDEGDMSPDVHIKLCALSTPNEPLFWYNDIAYDHDDWIIAQCDNMCDEHTDCVNCTTTTTTTGEPTTTTTTTEPPLCYHIEIPDDKLTYLGADLYINRQLPGGSSEEIVYFNIPETEERVDYYVINICSIFEPLFSYGSPYNHVSIPEIEITINGTCDEDTDCVSPTTTSTSSTTTTSTTIECPSCYYYDLYCDGVEGQSSLFSYRDCTGQYEEQTVPFEASPWTLCSTVLPQSIGAVSGHVMGGSIPCTTTTTTTTIS